MSTAAKTGYVADFKIGYLQRALIEHQVEVVGGTDISYDSKVTGFAVGRLVKLTRLADGTATIIPAANVTATSIGDATHIVAQSDDSLRNVPGDAIPVEKYSTRNRNILGNTTDTTVVELAQSPLTGATVTMKSVALYKIVNADDVRIIPVAPATVSVVR